MATFASLGGANLAMPFIPLYIQRELGVADPRDAAIWAGTATAGTGLAMAIMAPLWGMYADRHGRKAMLVRAQVALALSNSASALVLAPWQLVGVRAVQGGFSGVVGASRALVATTVPRDRIPYALGLIQSAIFMGQTLGPAAGGLIGGTFGFRAAFFGTAGLNAVAGVLAFMFVKEDPVTPRIPVDGPAGRPGAGERAGVVEPAPAPKDIRRRLARLGGLVRASGASSVAMVVYTLFLATSAMTCIRPILPLLLAELETGRDATTLSGMAFAVLGLAAAIASLASGKLGTRVGLGRLLVLAAVAGSAANLGVMWATATWTVLAWLFGLGLCQGALAACASTLLSLHTSSGRQGTAFGILTSGQALAIGVGPLLGGLVASAGGLAGAFGLAAGLLLAAAACGVAIAAPRQGDPAS